MKIIIIILSFLCSISLRGQKFANTEWIQISAVNRDSSKIIDRLNPGSGSIKYYFTEDSVSISANEQYSTRLMYSVKDRVLFIGSFVKYKIDSISDPFLVVSDIPRKGYTNDRLYTFTFLSTEYLFDYLKQNDQIEIAGDSLIICNSMFSPAYSGDMNELFRDQYGPEIGEEAINGTFTMSKEGAITDIEVTSSLKHTKRGIDNITRIIKSTERSWIIPLTPSPFKYKLSFSLYFHKEKDITSIGFTLNPLAWIK